MDLAEVLGKQIEKELIEAHKRGYAEGLEAAANTVKGREVELVDTTRFRYRVEQDLRDEAKRVREMGVNDENTQ